MSTCSACYFGCLKLLRQHACAQVSAGRPIPVLPQHTFPGSVVLSGRATSGLSPPVHPDAELERLCLGHLAAAAKEALAALSDVPAHALPPGGAGGGASSGAAGAEAAPRGDASDGSASDHMSGEPMLWYSPLKTWSEACSRGCLIRAIPCMRILWKWLHTSKPGLGAPNVGWSRCVSIVAS